MYFAGNQVCLIYRSGETATEAKRGGGGTKSVLAAALIELDRAPWNNSKTKDGCTKVVPVVGSTGAVSVADLKESGAFASCVRWSTSLEISDSTPALAQVKQSKQLQEEKSDGSATSIDVDKDSDSKADISITAYVCSAGDYLFVLGAGADVSVLDGMTGDVLLHLSRSQSPTCSSLLSATTDFTDAKSPAVVGIFANGAVERVDLGPLVRKVKTSSHQKRWNI